MAEKRRKKSLRKPDKNGDHHSKLSALVDLQSSFSAPVTVRDIMTTKVITMSPKDTFGEAVGLMANRPFRHFFVVDKNQHLAGVISDRDLLRILARTPEWQRTCVGDVMTDQTVTVQPETSLSAAVEKMLERRINCLPVVDEDGKVCGIVTSTDMLRVLTNIQACLERVREVGLA